MKKVEIALKEAGLTMNELPNKTAILVSDLKKLLNGINLQKSQGKEIKQDTLDRAESYRDRIIEDIAYISENKDDDDDDSEEEKQAKILAQKQEEERLEKEKQQQQQSQRKPQEKSKMEKIGSGLRFWDWD